MSQFEVKAINCGSCGAPLEISSAFTKSIICPYCDTTNMIDDKSVNPGGKVAKIAESPSMFKIGRTGSIEGRKFNILGRLRYGYEEGFWDEWFLQFEDGQCGWLTDEEGEISLFYKDLLTSPIENIDKIRVGQFVQIEDKKVFVTEISDASILGGEGELHYRVMPGKEVLHLEGNASGKLVSIEVWPKEIEVHTGSPVAFSSVQMDLTDNPYI